MVSATSLSETFWDPISKFTINNSWIPTFTKTLTRLLKMFPLGLGVGVIWSESSEGGGGGKVGVTGEFVPRTLGNFTDHLDRDRDYPYRPHSLTPVVPLAS